MDGQTDRQTEFSSLDRVCISCSAVKIDVTKGVGYLSQWYRTTVAYRCAEKVLFIGLKLMEYVIHV